MSINNHTPPLLLTKRLTSFLSANLSSTLHAALLITPSGKLLAHAATPAPPATVGSPSSSNISMVSPTNTTAPPPTPSSPPEPSATCHRPGSVVLLRTQATVAASLYTLHSSASPSIPDALPGSRSESTESLPPQQQDGDGSARTPGTSGSGKPLTITVQLSNGVMVIRRLKCGLLFVCIGPLGGDGSAATTEQQYQALAETAAATAASLNGTTGQTSGGGGGLAVPGTATPSKGGHASPANIPTSPQGSVLSTGGVTTASIASAGSSVAGSVGTAAVVSMRRHAEELARWLDDKLGSLSVPEEGVGVE